MSSNIEYLCPEIASVSGNHVYASASFSAAKPDVGVFHRCLEKLRALPHETFFVDDLPDNIAGARLAGLNVHHFTGYRSLADALALRGLICAA
ncbi:HAD-IA family hydrolase [Paraburkholderia flagellata]|uniref:HAD-IA family hydrolase n=1 Tax=Paraburkholderia flagellata TaxID=2883241 RepID=UPI003570B506